MRDKAREQAVNQLLLARQTNDIRELRDCEKGRHPKGAKNGDFETVRVSFLSGRFLSLDVRQTVWTCAPYPQLDMPRPITVDLQTGTEVDWKSFFTKGFIPTAGFQVTRAASPRLSGLTRLYLKQYKDTVECASLFEMGDADGYGFDLWLDRREGALIADPNLPHVSRACAVPIAIPFAEIIPYVADKGAADDLRGARPR